MPQSILSVSQNPRLPGESYDQWQARVNPQSGAASGETSEGNTSQGYTPRISFEEYPQLDTTRLETSPDQIGKKEQQRWRSLQAETEGEESIDRARSLVERTEQARAQTLSLLGSDEQQSFVDDPRLATYESRYTPNQSIIESILTGGNFAKEHPTISGQPSEAGRKALVSEGKRADKFYRQQQADLKAEIKQRRLEILQEEQRTRKKKSRERADSRYGTDEELLALQAELEKATQAIEENKYPSGDPRTQAQPFFEASRTELQEYNLRDPEDARRLVSEFNDELQAVQDEISEAARAGDYEKADELTAKRDKLFDHYLFTGETGASLREAFEQTRDPNVTAQIASANPVAQEVGRRLRTSEQLFDTDSEEYQKRFSAITDAPLTRIRGGEEAAQRIISAAQASTERRAREMGRSAGVWRNPQEMTQILSRVDEMSSTQRAQVQLEASTQAAAVLGEANRFMVEFADQYANFAAESALDYVNQAPLLQQTYLEALVAIDMVGTNYERSLLAESNARLSHLETLGLQESQFDKNMRLAIIDSTVGAAISAGAVGVAGA